VQANVEPGVGGADAVDERRQIVAKVAADAEKKRHDVDARRAFGREPADGRAEVGLHQLEESQLDTPARIGAADALGDGGEGLGPAVIARAVREQDQSATHAAPTLAAFAAALPTDGAFAPLFIICIAPAS
jgi:hypothetical protein